MVYVTGSNPTTPDYMQESQPETIIVGGKVYKVANETLKVQEEALSDKVGRAFNALAQSQIVKVALAIVVLRLIDIAQQALLKQVPVHCKDVTIPGIDNPEELATKVINDTATDLRQSVFLSRSQLLVS